MVKTRNYQGEQENHNKWKKNAPNAQKKYFEKRTTRFTKLCATKTYLIRHCNPKIDPTSNVIWLQLQRLVIGCCCLLWAVDFVWVGKCGTKFVVKRVVGGVQSAGLLKGINSKRILMRQVVQNTQNGPNIRVLRKKEEKKNIMMNSDKRQTKNRTRFTWKEEKHR